MYCVKCGTSLEESWIYCPTCAEQSVSGACAKCGNTLINAWEYCPRCGETNPNYKSAPFDYDDSDIPF